MKFRMDARVIRESKSLLGLNIIGMFIAQNKQLAIGTSNVDKLYQDIIEKYPDAKLSKCKGYVLIGGKEG